MFIQHTVKILLRTSVGCARSGGSPEFSGGKNGIICARARSSVYATEWGIFEIVSTKTILQTIDAQKVRPKTVLRIGLFASYVVSDTVHK